MVRRLPSLNALRAFEAAARHLSFTKAAEELHVTQAAISHQVKTLEEQLGRPLFRRLNRRLLLTDAGQTYVSGLTAAFDGIAEATEQVTTAQNGGSLRISTLPSMAARWLLPRLSRFRARHSDIDVLGPMPGYPARVRGHYRWQLHLRGPHPRRLLEDGTLPRGWVVDVDPVGLD